MNRCRRCHKFIYQWQDYFVYPEQIQYYNDTVLIQPDYDRWEHMSCSFHAHNNNQIQQTKED